MKTILLSLPPSAIGDRVVARVRGKIRRGSANLRNALGQWVILDPKTLTTFTVPLP
jgi:hypothetical protein